MIENTVKLFAIGDVVFNNKFFGKENTWSPEYPFESCRKYVERADISLLNLEGALSERGTPIRHKSSLRSHPYWFKGMKDTGFNVFNLANNHIFDFGIEAIDDTVQMIDNSNNHYVGYGKNLEAASRPLLLNSNGISVAIFSCCTVVNKAHLYADEMKPGIPFADVSAIQAGIRAAKESADVVIVLFHWGLENFLYPTPEQIMLGHAAIDAGAALVLGHHPHVIQGIEKYKHGIIAYSLGNFIFSDIYWEGVSPSGDDFIFEKKWTDNNKKSLAFECVLSKNGIESYNVRYFKSAENLLPTEDDSDQRRLELERQSRVIDKNYGVFWKRYSFLKELDDIYRVVCDNLKNLITKPHKLRMNHIRSLTHKLVVAISVIKGRNAR